jgi:KilA-N domain
MLSLLNYSGKQIRFEQRGDRVWVSLTDMAQATGKRINNWFQLKSTTEFLSAMSDDIVNSTIAGITAMTQPQGFEAVLIVNKGGDTKQSGTWAIEEVALDFAAWCNVDFRIWVWKQIKTLLNTGKVELQKHDDCLCPSKQLTYVEIFQHMKEFKSLHRIALDSGNIRLQQKVEAIIHQYLDTHFAIAPTQPIINHQPTTVTGGIRYEGCIDVAIRLGYKVPSRFEGAMGRNIKSQVPHLVIKANEDDLKDYRASSTSGKVVPAFMYPAFNEEVESAVTDYCETKGFSCNRHSYFALAESY